MVLVSYLANRSPELRPAMQCRYWRAIKTRWSQETVGGLSAAKILLSEKYDRDYFFFFFRLPGFFFLLFFTSHEFIGLGKVLLGKR